MATRGASKTAGNRAGLPGWLMLLLGLGTGLLVALFVNMLELLRHSRPAPAVSQAESTPSAVANASPQFDFYRMLPELEVSVPEDAYYSSPKVRPTTVAAIDAGQVDEQDATRQRGSERFLLQAGSFKQAQQADELKARLALLGMEAIIEPVVVGNTTWHRVRLGPFDDRVRAEQARARLGSNQIQAMIVREPG